MTLSIRQPALFAAIVVSTALSAQSSVSTGCIGELTGQACGPRLNTITTAVPVPDDRSGFPVSGGMGDAGVALPADANAIALEPQQTGLR
jgi:hypothetical protein